MSSSSNIRMDLSMKAAQMDMTAYWADRWSKARAGHETQSIADWHWDVTPVGITVVFQTPDEQIGWSRVRVTEPEFFHWQANGERWR